MGSTRQSTPAAAARGLAWGSRWHATGGVGTNVTDQLDAAGLPDELGAVDLLLHRGEANPRTRSGIMALEILDTTPDWDRYREVYENASRRVLRLRQKVVVPTVPTAA